MNLFIIIIVIYLLKLNRLDKMGDFSKPKVTIDLEEYNSLLDKDSLDESVESYKKLLSVILTAINYQTVNNGLDPTMTGIGMVRSQHGLNEIKDVVKLAESMGLEIMIERHRDVIEVKEVIFKNK